MALVCACLPQQLLSELLSLLWILFESESSGFFAWIQKECNHRSAMNDRHQIAPYPIRMPQELRERLEQAAKDGNRSLHAEIVARLHQSFDTRDTDIAQGTASAMLKSLTQAINHANQLAKRLELIEKKRS